MEPFQQYLAETFPGDGKRSTSGVVHKLDLTVNACRKTKTLRRLVSCHTYESSYSFYHSSWV